MIKKLLTKLNTFFKNAASNLNINKSTYIINHDSRNPSDPIDKAICKYKFHQNILLIKYKLENQRFFCFKPYQNFTWRKKFKILILKRQLLRSLSNLKFKKISRNTSAETLRNLFNECLITDNFPYNLKLAGITPVFKKKDPLNKENYRPASVLPT